jgi:hypothetical protein
VLQGVIDTHYGHGSGFSKVSALPGDFFALRLARYLLHFKPWQQGFILLDLGAAFGKLWKPKEMRPLLRPRSLSISNPESQHAGSSPAGRVV